MTRERVVAHTDPGHTDPVHTDAAHTDPRHTDADPVHADADAGPGDAMTRLTFLAAASEVLAGSLDVDETLEGVVRLAVPELGDTCTIELLRGDELEVVAIADADPVAEATLRTHAATMRIGDHPEYPPRRVVESGHPILVAEVPAAIYRRFVGDADQLAFLLAHRAGTGMCVPLRARGQVLGAMSFARLAGKQPYTGADLTLATEIGQRAALAIDNAQLYAARERSESVQRFLAEVTRALSAELDFDASLRRLARLAVPFLADVCIVDGVEAGRIRRLAAAHADPSRQPLVDELVRRFPPDPRREHPAVRAIRTGEAAYGSDMSEEFLRATTRDAEHYEIVRELGVVSYACAPLRARGHMLGALSLVSCDSSRRFGPEDLALVEEVADRAALVLDNSRLLTDRSRVARALQASLLPPELPDIPGVDLAARYVAAGEGNEVGGDFYDVFWTGYGSWAVVIGDVCGKGPEAAAITGLVRHTVRAIALHDREPRRILRGVHAVLSREERLDERFCTLACGILRPQTGRGQVRLTVACAGHPPPLILRADGRLEEADCPGTLLGLLEEVALRQDVVLLGPGDVVVLYTDGVVEARRGGDVFGEERLKALLAGIGAATASAIAARIVEAVRSFGPAEPRDDLALLVLRVLPEP